MNLKKIMLLILILLATACGESKKSQPSNETSPNSASQKAKAYTLDEVFERLIGGKKSDCIEDAPRATRDYFIKINFKLETSTGEDVHWLVESYDFLENGAALINREVFYSLSGRWDPKLHRAKIVGRWEREDNVIKIYDQNEILLITVAITNTVVNIEFDAVFGPEHPLEFLRNQQPSENYSKTFARGGTLNFENFPEQMDFYNQLAADCP